MITVAIIGIIASIALPSYQQYIIRSHRVAAQVEMLDVANRQQQFFLANRIYATTTLELGYVLPADLSARYTVTLGTNNAATPPSFNITFTAQGPQASDVNLTLNNQGIKTPADKW